MRSTGLGLSLLVVTMLAGCSAVPVAKVGSSAVTPSAVTPSAERVSVSGQLEPDRVLAVLELLDAADRALKDRRLSKPRGDSAVDYYRRVLALLPGYEEAQQGLKTIVDRYIEWSDAAVRQGRSDRALSYLARARQIDADDPDIVQAAQRLRTLGQREIGYVRLDARELRLKSADLVLVLGRLADRVRAESARVVIQAPTDAQGRWIYRQLNQRHENFRIRASLRLDAQPGVRLLY